MPVRATVAVGLVGTALAVVLVGLLHVIDAGQVDPVRRTISEYALRDHGWMFDVGVLALAAGSVAVLIALVRAGLMRWPSFAAVGMLVWVAGMVAVVAFEKTNWSVGPSIGGMIHRYASLVAFLALPVAALVAARSRRRRLAPVARDHGPGVAGRDPVRGGAPPVQRRAVVAVPAAGDHGAGPGAHRGGRRRRAGVLGAVAALPARRDAPERGLVAPESR